MYSLGTFPGVGECLIGGSTNVTCDQRVHGLCGDICGGLASSGDLSDLGIEDALFVGVNFESSKNVDLLDE